MNGGKSFVAGESIFCGDAAGRKEGFGMKRDFSADDLLFAKGLGFKFFTPELFFLGKDERLQNEKHSVQ